MTPSLFVTGAGGYLGRRVLALADQAHDGRIVCLSRSGQPVPNASETIGGDLLDGESYASALKTCETVLHLAAATGKNPPAEYFRVNREGTRILLEQCRKAGVKRILHVSTIAVKFPHIEHYYYAQSKLQAEALVRESGLEYCIVRPTMIFGKGAPVLEGLSRLAGAPVVPLFGGGRAIVQPVFVDDLAKGLLSLLRASRFDGQTIDSGGPDVMTMKDLLVEIRQTVYGKPARLLPIPVGPLSAVLAILEKFMLPLLPVTAGQLTSFTSDGTAGTPHPGAGRMTTVREILRMAAAR